VAVKTHINPRDRVRVAGHPDIYTVYVAALYNNAVCVTDGTSRRWVDAHNVTLVGRADPIDWKIGDRFALRAGNGLVVRHGTLLESTDGGNWFVQVDTGTDQNGDEMDGFKTWLNPETLVPIAEEN